MAHKNQEKLPPPGPAWAGSLMGTSILATLCEAHGLFSFAVAALAFATVVLLVLTAGWALRREPGWDADAMAPWGMMSMGVMSLGSAATSVTGQGVWQLAAWWVGAPLAWVVCVKQLRNFPGEPTFQWGLALVAPMVAATNAAQLDGEFYTAAGIASFLLTLCTAIPVFGYCYNEFFHGRMDIPDKLGGTTWIPLGVVGQSTAAAQLLFEGKPGVYYSLFMVVMGAGPVAFAAVRFARSVARWADYGPGWWGSTFPVGTLSLGAHMLAESTSWVWFDTVSAALLGLLAVHIALCVARFGCWVGEGKPRYAEPV